jgi:tetratricopeptide (TPR) repeat protein
MNKDIISPIIRKSGLPLLIILVLAVFLPILHNGFVSWDDDIYIVNNTLLRSMGWSQVRHLFTSSFEGHYHPLTLLSLSLDYHLFGTNPLAFHLHNLLLHLLNTLLVYQIIKKLSNNVIIAWVTALLFGLHPMHVEAVVWATARKDVLYTLFFLLSVMFYFRSKEKNDRRWYYLSLLIFVFSVLSKGQAVFLPLCLVLFSFFRGKKIFGWENWRDKLPFIVVALGFGIIALIAQRETGYMGEARLMQPVWKLILTANLSLWMYFYKLILPISLSAYYPVPGQGSPGYLVFSVLSCLLTLSLIFSLVKYLRNNRFIVTGTLFFLVNIVVFLRWIPVSNYIIADRYTYVSSIGIFFLAGYAISRLLDNKKTLYLGSILILFLTIAYGSLTFSRVSFWKDSQTLVNDILSKYPDVYPALNTRGIWKMENGDFRGALMDFNHAIEVQPQHSRAWANRGTLFYKSGKVPEALMDFDKAVSLDPANSRLLNNRALLLDVLGKTDKALEDVNLAIANDAYFAEAYNNRGRIMARTGRPEEAILDFTHALSINPTLLTAYVNRGMAKNQMADFKSALADFETAEGNGFNNPALCFEMGFSYYNLKDFYHAETLFDKALQQKPDYYDALKYRGFTRFNGGDFISSIDDLDKALALDTNDALLYAMRGLAFIRVHKTEDACRDFARAEHMGLPQAKKEREKYCK